jgi:hypothetical protein
MSPSASKLEETKAILAAMVKEAAELKQAMGGSITDTVAEWLAPQYLLAASEKLEGAAGARRWEILRTIIQDWTVLRRGDHSAARLQLDREELDLVRANSEAKKEQQFREWLKRPDIRAEIFPEKTRGLTPETLKQIEEMLNLL